MGEDFRYLYHADPREAMRAALPHGVDGATADAGVRYARPLHFDSWLDGVTDGPDAHRLPGLRQFQRCFGKADILSYFFQERITVDFEHTVLPARAAPEDHITDGERSQFKTHEPPPARPASCPPDRITSVYRPQFPELSERYG